MDYHAQRVRGAKTSPRRADPGGQGARSHQDEARRLGKPGRRGLEASRTRCCLAVESAERGRAVVRIGFVVEGASERVVVESRIFRQWLQQNGMNLVDPVVVAGGHGQMGRTTSGGIGLASLLRKQVSNLWFLADTTAMRSWTGDSSYRRVPRSNSQHAMGPPEGGRPCKAGTEQGVASEALGQPA